MMDFYVFLGLKLFIIGIGDIILVLYAVFF